VGEIERAMKLGATLMIVSDHGFHTWRKGFNTNTWLVENGYMALKNPGAQEKTYNLDQLFGQGSFFPNVDWSRTKAYAVGLGQIYLNVRGRERLGVVDWSPAGEVSSQAGRGPCALEASCLLGEIRRKLLAFRDPDTGEAPIQNVYLASEIFHGSRMTRAPELQIDFRDGYRTSWQTSLGAIPAGIVVANMKKWSGDHCASDPTDTSGIFLSNRRISTPEPGILDIAPTVLGVLSVQEPSPLDGRRLDFQEQAAAQQGSY